MSANNFSVDESMIPYYGKPIQFGFKLWCLCSLDEDLPHAERYCGKDTNLPDTGLDQGSDVFSGMIEKCNLTKGSTVAMGNFFTTFSLLDKLTDMVMYEVHNIRESRL